MPDRTRRGYGDRLKNRATAFLQITLFTLLGVVLADALAAQSGALWDDRLAAADRAAGFNWPVVLSLLDKAPPAIWVLGLAYRSLMVQMIVVIVALSGLPNFDPLSMAVCAAILSGFVTILISGSSLPSATCSIRPTTGISGRRSRGWNKG